MDDPRDCDNHGRLRAEASAEAREPSQGSRGGSSDSRERASLDPRDVFTRDLVLPRGPERERVWARDSDVGLRGSEVRTLATVGAFRVVRSGRAMRFDVRRPRELTHDAQVYRAYLKEAERLREEGARSSVVSSSITS